MDPAARSARRHAPALRATLHRLRQRGRQHDQCCVGTFRFEISMSLDGYVTAADVRPEEPMGDGGQVLHEWAFGTDDRGRDVHAESQGSVGATSPVAARARRRHRRGPHPPGPGTARLRHSAARCRRRPHPPRAHRCRRGVEGDPRALHRDEARVAVPAGLVARAQLPGRSVPKLHRLPSGSRALYPRCVPSKASCGSPRTSAPAARARMTWASGSGTARYTQPWPT